MHNSKLNENGERDNLVNTTIVYSIPQLMSISLNARGNDCLSGSVGV